MRDSFYSWFRIHDVLKDVLNTEHVGLITELLHQLLQECAVRISLEKPRCCRLGDWHRFPNKHWFGGNSQVWLLHEKSHSPHLREQRPWPQDTTLRFAESLRALLYKPRMHVCFPGSVPMCDKFPTCRVIVPICDNTKSYRWFRYAIWLFITPKVNARVWYNKS